jgi:hypothetical protein
MKVSYEESGGFANLRRGCQLDTDQLPAAEAAQLQCLIESSQAAQSMERRSPRARDAIQYDFTIERAGQTHHIAVDDLTMPASLRPLLQVLRKHARPLPG